MTELFRSPPLMQRRLLIASIFGVLICVVAISSKSYWLDEAGVAWRATLPSLGEWWQRFRYGDANLQLPFYHIFVRCWVKLAGINEFALRFGNAPWFLLGLMVFVRALEGVGRLLSAAVLVLLTNPFVWYYLDEARPYAMQIGASLIVFGALFRLSREIESSKEFRWVGILCFGAVLLAGSGLLAMLWLGAYLLAAAICVPKGRLKEVVQNYWPAWTATFVMLLIVGIYYLWTLTLGIRTQMVGTTDLRNLPFVAYELLGFSGLGPSRLAIRAEGLNAFHGSVWLVIYGIFLGLVLVSGLRSVKDSTTRRTIFAWCCAFAVICAFITGVGVAVRFRVLGRHFAPLIPLVVFVLGAGVVALLNRPSLLARAIPLGFLTLSLVSALSLRFNRRHAKDEYRGAALIGVEALRKGEVVWWNADPDGALIYHLPLAERDPSAKGVHFLMNPAKGFEQKLPKPDLVLASKADVYDQKDALRDYLTRSGFTPVTNLPAFTAWHAPIK